MSIKKPRSKQYPGAGLEECIHASNLAVNNLVTGTHDTNTLAKAIGYKAYNGAAGVKISAMVQFGLLELKKGTGYSLSSLARMLAHPKDKEEEKAAVIQALWSPELYAALYTQYEPAGKLPNLSSLTNILIRDYGILSHSGEKAAQTFWRSAVYADAIDENGNFTSAVDRKSAADQNEFETLHSTQGQQLPSKDDSHMNNYQQLDFGLTEGKSARLVLPNNMNNSDIQLLEKQLEFVRLQVELSATGSVPNVRSESKFEEKEETEHE